MNITKITIGRLYNLGNYEHVRYELTADIPAGESPATCLIGMEKLLAALNPARPPGVPTLGDIKSAEDRLALTYEMTDEEIARKYGKCRALVLHKMNKELLAKRTRQQSYDAELARARKQLDDLAGAANYVDAKRDWHDDDYDVQF